MMGGCCSVRRMPRRCILAPALLDDVGIEDGYGATLNLPLPYGTGDRGLSADL